MTCKICNGTRECIRCKGTGEIDSGGADPQGHFINTDCPDCHGSGDCSQCGGYAFANDPAPNINAVRGYLTYYLIKARNEHKPLTISRALGNCIGWLLVGIHAKRQQWIVCVTQANRVGALERDLYLVRATTEAKARTKIQGYLSTIRPTVHIGVKPVRDEEVQVVWRQPRVCSG